MNLTIIGLGRIGASIGLAMAARREQIHRIGHDISPETARLASQLGCIDKVSHNLPDSVRQADVVLLALPLDQIEDTLRIIGQDLPAGALVLETAPAKTRVTAWAKEHLPPQCTYVGLSPILNARYLLDHEQGPAAGRADLFEDSQVGVSVPPGISEGAFNLALYMVEMLGARPLFIDPQEADGVLAALHLLPQLASAGLHAAVSRQPGWQENRKLGGGPFARSSAVLLEGDTPEALGSAAVSGQADMLRLLDALIDELQKMRAQLADPDLEGLVAGLRRAAETQAEWRNRREVGDWETRTDTPDVQPRTWRQRLGGLFGSSRPDDGG